MKFNLSWLKEFIDLKEPPEKLREMLTSLGLEVESVTPLDKGDVLFEVALTPNLIHAGSILGIARELAALTNAPVKMASYEFKSEKELDRSIHIENKKNCPRYAAIAFDIKMTPSPQWLQERLELVGMRPKNLVVDVTNYVMHELGQPLHAFDLGKVGKKIVIRDAKKDEKLVLLDEKEIYLLPDTLVIADETKPLALAGIMGGIEAEVTENTTHVLVEAAFFDPSCIRRTAKKLGIATAASYYFERGTDPNMLSLALQRVVSLLDKSLTSVTKISEKKEATFEPKKILCRISRVNQVLGINLVLNEVETIFKRLGFNVRKEKEDTLGVQIPSFRFHDIKEEIDLIEEVARLYGYNNIFQKGDAVVYRSSSVPDNPFYPFLKKVRFHLFGEGLQEILTCNLISPEEAATVSPAIFPRRALVKLLNPNSLAHSVMRPSLLPNALQVIKENSAHGIMNLACFEVGKVHFKVKEDYVEPTSLAIYLTGQKEAHGFGQKENNFDFYDLKGVLENFFCGLKLEGVNFSPSTFQNFHPYRQAKIEIGANPELGIMGELHPAFLKEMGVDFPIFYAELDLNEIYPLVKKDIKMVPLPLFPASSRDWTITIDKKFLAKDLLKIIREIPSKILEDVLLLDVYQSDKLGSEVKNVTLRFIYRDKEKTLSFEEVEKEHANIMERVLKKVKV